MTAIERDLVRLGRFIPGFFGMLAVIVAGLPLIDRLFLNLPVVVRHPDVASLLATIAAFAFIGGHYLHNKGRIVDRLPTGRTTIVAGVALTIAYVGVGDLLMSQVESLPPLADVALVLWYVATYSVLAFGLWQMGWRAYRTRDKEISDVIVLFGA